MPVKFYPDPLSFAGVIREKPILSKYIITLSCICMTVYSDIYLQYKMKDYYNTVLCCIVYITVMHTAHTHMRAVLTRDCRFRFRLFICCLLFY